jgi:chitodextrinase
VLVLGALVCAAGAIAAPARAAGPVAAYSFDEGAGATLHDLSGTGNAGNVSGASWTAGRFGDALDFDGADDWATVADSDSLDLFGALTLEAWVEPSATAGSWRTVALKEQSSQLVYALYAANDRGTPSGHVNPALDTAVSGPAALPAATWTHLATTWDGTVLSLYVNGSLVASRLALGVLLPSGGALRIGGNAVWGEWFDGKIDELRIYARALSAAEIAADMATPVDVTPPTAPANLAAAASATSVQLTWAPSSDDSSVKGYGVYVDGALVSTTNDPSATIGGLACEHAYTLALDAFDAAGNHSPRATIDTQTRSCDTQPPTMPQDLTAVASPTAVTLTWSRAVDDVGVAGYGLYAGAARVAETTATTYAFTALRCGTTYTFGVDAYDAEGNRSPEATIEAATEACPPPDTQAPTAPTGLRATAVTPTSAALAWDTSNDDVRVAGYRVSVDGKSVGETAATTFSVDGLVCGTSYSVGVAAFDDAGNTSDATTIAVETSACPTTTASVFVAPAGSDANPCTQIAPCASFDRAYHVAQPGQIVEVAPGVYPEQTLLYDATKQGATQHVVIQPTPGGSVTIDGNINVSNHRTIKGAAHLTIRNMTVLDDVNLEGCGVQDGEQCPPDATAGTNDLTFDHLRVKGAVSFLCHSCSNVQILGGVWGPDTYLPCHGSWHPEVSPSYDELTGLKLKRPNHILIDGARFQNFARCTGADHTECLQFEPADYVTIRNSVFTHCDTITLAFFTSLAGASRSGAGYAAPDHIVVENNFIDHSYDATGGETYHGLHFTECTNCVIRNNSWVQDAKLPCNAPCGEISLNNVVVGNAGPQTDCGNGGITFSHNVFQGTTCGPTDLDVDSLGFADQSSLDLHLLAGSPAIDAGDPASFPATDIDGDPRPAGGAPDAGADER